MDKVYSVSRILVAVALLVALITVSPRPAAAVNAVPDLLGPDQPLTPAQSELEPLALRARGAQLNLSELDQARADLERGQIPQPLALSLFPDVRLLAYFERVEHPITGGYSLAGKIGADPLAEIHLSRIGNTFYASLNTPQGMFQISSQDGQTARIVQIDPVGLGRENEPITPAQTEPVRLPDSVVTVGPSTVDDGSRIDVYVGYTPAAKNEVAATGIDILNKINVAIAETNTGYANSGINQRVVLVGTGEYAYTETGLNLSTILDHWTGASDGYMDAAHTARDFTKADEMVLLTKDPTGLYCGMAWMMGSGSISPSFASSAFAVVDWYCATGDHGYYSFAHEMGHNMGAAHNREAGTGPGAYPGYSYGSWIWIPSTEKYDYRTIMAYNTNGAVDAYRSGIKLTYDSRRVNLWANPDVIYAGQPTGAGLSAQYPAYDALTLNNTAPSVAQFRDGAAPAAPAGLTATGLSATSTRLDWTDNSSDETRFRIERAPISGGDWAEIGQVGPNLTTYTDSSILPNSDYRYRVLSDNGNGRAASTETMVPAPPTALKVNPLTDPTQIDLAWSDHSAVDNGYQVSRSSDNGANWTLLPVTTSSFYHDTAAACGLLNRYRVWAYTSAATSAYAENSATTHPCAPLFKTSSSTSAIYFSWLELAGVTSYSVEFKEGSVFVAIPRAESLPPATTHYTWKGLPKNFSYTVRVVAVNSSGATSAPATTVNARLYDFFLLPFVSK